MITLKWLIDADVKYRKELQQIQASHDKEKVQEEITPALKFTKADVELMIWEVDDDTDGLVSEAEFIKMYKRCINDEKNLEPRKLFNLVMFLMYDKQGVGKVAEEETLEILFVRHGREKLDTEIQAIFGGDELNVEGGEKKITFPVYYQKVNKRAMEHRKEMKNKQQMRDDKGN